MNFFRIKYRTKRDIEDLCFRLEGKVNVSEFVLLESEKMFI